MSTIVSINSNPEEMSVYGYVQLPEENYKKLETLTGLFNGYVGISVYRHFDKRNFESLRVNIYLNHADLYSRKTGRFVDHLQSEAEISPKDMKTRKSFTLLVNRIIDQAYDKTMSEDAIFLIPARREAPRGISSDNIASSGFACIKNGKLEYGFE
jgi:hypothetical protein